MSVNQKQTESSKLEESIESLKIEVREVKNALQNMEDTLLKDRLKSVENALAQNRLLCYTTQLEGEVKNDFFRLMKNGCESQIECTEKVSKFFSDKLQLIKELKIKQALEDLDGIIKFSNEAIKNPQKKECLQCFENVNKKLKRERRNFQTIGSIEKSWEKKEQSDIDIKFVVKSFLEPLSNQNRLMILASLYNGKKSFSELSKVTGKSGGPLIFHLNKLVNSKLITQETNQGDYIVTQKGIEALELISAVKKPI
jgi:DNA-binding HxlR family transcriptional regulator